MADSGFWPLGDGLEPARRHQSIPRSRFSLVVRWNFSSIWYIWKVTEHFLLGVRFGRVLPLRIKFSKFDLWMTPSAKFSPYTLCVLVRCAFWATKIISFLTLLASCFSISYFPTCLNDLAFQYPTVNFILISSDSVAFFLLQLLVANAAAWDSVVHLTLQSLVPKTVAPNLFMLVAVRSKLISVFFLFTIVFLPIFYDRGGTAGQRSSFYPSLRLAPTSLDCKQVVELA